MVIKIILVGRTGRDGKVFFAANTLRLLHPNHLCWCFSFVAKKIKIRMIDFLESIRSFHVVRATLLHVARYLKGRRHNSMFNI